MLGHGRPRKRPNRPTGPISRRIALAILLVGFALESPGRLDAATEPQGAASSAAVSTEAPVVELRLRIAWGGGTGRQWEGAVWASQGQVANPAPLGIEADEPGSMWLSNNRLEIRQRSVRTYDGVDLTVQAPLATLLMVEFRPAGEEKPITTEIPLSELVGGFRNANLDETGNRLLVNRTPGDQLRVEMSRNHLVFSPGETFSLELRPHLLPVDPGTKVQLALRVLPASGGKPLWQHEQAVVTGESTSLPLAVPVPQAEGTYTLEISATRIAWPSVRAPLDWKDTLAQRTVQFLVLAPTPSPATDREGDLATLVEIDPANPRWWEPLARITPIPTLKGIWKGPLGNGMTGTRAHELGTLAELRPNQASPDVSWEAYFLPIRTPGCPHVLEMEYPSDIAQSLGVSVLEPNAARALMPVSLETGIDLDDPPPRSAGPPRWLRHRVIFWPQTRTPLVLVTNRRSDSPAVYGKIRVLAGWQHLPPAANAAPGGRFAAAYLHRPLLGRALGATEALDAASKRSFDDWTTFYEGGSRLIEYLHHVGYDGAIVSVMADGSTLYPSNLLEPSGRYDRGGLFTTGQDPLRKHVLEMLLRQFDRDGLRLIPALDFAAPLPALEAEIRRGGSEPSPLAWIGPQGLAFQQVHPPQLGRSVYYNILDPRVQSAMLDVIREAAGQAASHPSFAGLAIQLSADGYAQLPTPDWGMDDETIARFERDQGIVIGGNGPQRFAQRAALLRAQYRRVWLQWRAAQLAGFYGRVQRELAAIAPGRKLYLAGANLFSGEELEYELRPTLPRRMTLAQGLLLAGIAPELYADEHAPVLLQPERLHVHGQIERQAVDLEIQQMPDAEQLFPTVRGGCLFFQEPEHLRQPSFDQRSPFQPSFLALVSQRVSAAGEGRARFLHALAANDPQVFINGGWMLPIGQEDDLRPLLAVFRRLPPVPFQAIGQAEESGTSQPVTFRWAGTPDRTYLYAVNEAPFECQCSIRLAAPEDSRVEEITGTRQVAPIARDAEGAYWAVKLAPYDLVAVAFSTPGVQFSRPRTEFDDAVGETLAERIRALSVRAASLRAPQPIKALTNADFELPAAGDGVSGWRVLGQSPEGARIETAERHAGNQSMRLTSAGPAVSLVSAPFDVRPTGRVSIAVWLRVPDPAHQPALLLAMESRRLDGREYYRFAPVGQAYAGIPAVQSLTGQWAQYVFHVGDLPLGGLAPLQVRFDMVGAGDVWIDDVQVFDLSFSESEELVEMKKIIALAQVNLRNGEVTDCMRLLGGYWPRFLETYVPVDRLPEKVAQRPARPSIAPPAAGVPKPGFLDRIKGVLPDTFRF